MIQTGRQKTYRDHFTSIYTKTWTHRDQRLDPPVETKVWTLREQSLDPSAGTTVWTHRDQSLDPKRPKSKTQRDQSLSPQSPDFEPTESRVWTYRIQSQDT